MSDFREGRTSVIGMMEWHQGGGHDACKAGSQIPLTVPLIGKSQRRRQRSRGLELRGPQKSFLDLCRTPACLQDPAHLESSFYSESRAWKKFVSYSAPASVSSQTPVALSPCPLPSRGERHMTPRYPKSRSHQPGLGFDLFGFLQHLILLPLLPTPHLPTQISLGPQMNQGGKGAQLNSLTGVETPMLEQRRTWAGETA